MKMTRGFTIVEVMVVIAIIAILTAVALPAYRDYSNRAAFSELVLAVNPRRIAVELAIQSRNPTAITDLDAATLGIPADVTATATVHGAAVLDGVITMTWQADGSTMAGTTYTLTPGGVTPPVEWTAAGTCQTNNLC